MLSGSHRRADATKGIALAQPDYSLATIGGQRLRQFPSVGLTTPPPAHANLKLNNFTHHQETRLFDSLVVLITSLPITEPISPQYSSGKHYLEWPNISAAATDAAMSMLIWQSRISLK
jgi:hypothetical protein